MMRADHQFAEIDVFTYSAGFELMKFIPKVGVEDLFVLGCRGAGS